MPSIVGSDAPVSGTGKGEDVGPEDSEVEVAVGVDVLLPEDDEVEVAVGVAV